MLHLYRIVFICFLIAIATLAVTHYASVQPRLAELEKRLVPMHPKQDVPVFTIDIEPIPAGMTARGTSFPLGNGLWLTARHVANTEECGEIILIVDGKNVPAQIKYMDPNADLAVLQTPPVAAPPLPIEAAKPADDESGFAFGFPHGMLGGTEDQLMGRARMKLGGRLMGTAPVLTWAELDRYPDSLDTLSGISGGPMFDEKGDVVGIIVAASVMRGRNYTVAPEILHEVQRELGLSGRLPNQAPASDVVAPPVSLDNSATALSKNARIALTYCIPPESLSER